MDTRNWHKYYPSGVPTHIDYPLLPLREHFMQRVNEHPQRDYIIYGDNHYSYQACNSVACRFANGLIQHGYQKQERIALMTGNVPKYIMALQACFKIGAAVVPTNPRYTAKELLLLFRRTGVSQIVVEISALGKMLEIIRKEQTNITKIVVVDNSGAVPPSCNGVEIIPWNEIVSQGQDAEPDIPVFSSDVALLQPTGGTTGVPKVSILTNANLEAMAYMTHYWFTPPLSGEVIKCLLPLPLYHIIGFNNNINFNMVGGGTLILVDPPTPANIIHNINKHEPNYFTAVPAMVLKLNQLAETRTSKIGMLKGMMVGGAPLPLEVHKEFETRYGLKIMQGYGLSETITISCTPFFNLQKPGTVGIPYPDTDVRVVDVEDATIDVGPGQSGEIIVKGPQVMPGYWDDEEETRRAFSGNGWFHTGDIAIQDEDGYITIVDRKKDLIISSGFNVFPREIDEVVYTHPAVLEACTIGVPDKLRGEAAKVFVVLKKDHKVSPQEIIEFCKEYLTAYKVPQEVGFVDEVPLTSVGKPDRLALRRWANEQAKQTR